MRVTRTTRATIARFLGGLNYEISNIMDLRPYVYLEDAFKLFVKIERKKRHGVIKPAATISNSNKPTTAINQWGVSNFSDPHKGKKDFPK